MTLSELFVLFLAVFGTSYLLHYTDGPWDFFFKFREELISLNGELPDVVYDDEGNEVYISGEDEGFFTKMFSCFWCSSSWVAVVIVGSYFLIMGYPLKLFPFVLAASIGVSGFLKETIASG